MLFPERGSQAVTRAFSVGQSQWASVSTTVSGLPAQVQGAILFCPLSTQPHEEDSSACPPYWVDAGR